MDVEQRAREIFAQQFPGDCGYETREMILSGQWPDREPIDAIRAALTPPEGYILAPVIPPYEMVKALADTAGCSLAIATLAYRDALSARPEVKP